LTHNGHGLLSKKAMAMACFQRRPWPWLAFKEGHGHGLLSKKAMSMACFQRRPWPWLDFKEGHGHGLLAKQAIAMAFSQRRPCPWLAFKEGHGHGLLAKKAMAMACLQRRPWQWLAFLRVRVPEFWQKSTSYPPKKPPVWRVFEIDTRVPAGCAPESNRHGLLARQTMAMAC
jgi:hypothetical protein